MKEGFSILYLNEHDMHEAVSMENMIDAVDEAYHIHHTKNYNMPTRVQVKDDDNTLVVMPCIGDDAFGSKLVTTFPGNKNAPMIHGLFILNSAKTGKVQALMDGAFLTGIRTGAIGGSAIRHLAPHNASALAIIGTGVQGFHQTIAACCVRPITDIYLYNRTPEKRIALQAKLASHLGTDVTIHLCDSAAEASQKADIIVTATTSFQPVLPDDKSLLKGKLLIGIGSFQPAMREFPEAAYSLADQILVDSNDAILESGDLIQPLENQWITKNNIQTMSSFLTQNNTTTKTDNTILFKSTGMALFDIVAANHIFQKAIEKGIGQLLNNREVPFRN